MIYLDIRNYKYNVQVNPLLQTVANNTADTTLLAA
jgi:hypothetical protein